jgi:hypothetical protein
VFDAGGFHDIKINAYRAQARRTNFTHRFSISLPSNEGLVAWLNNGGMAEWLANAAKCRKVVGNTTSRDVSK